MKRSVGAFLLHRIYAAARVELTPTLKTYDTVFGRIKRVVLAPAYIQTRMYFRATLPDQDISGKNKLTVGTLATETLGVAVSPVSRAANSFFMSKEL